MEYKTQNYVDIDSIENELIADQNKQSETNKLLLTQKSNSPQKQCNVVNIGKYKYNVCTKYAEWQSDAMNYLQQNQIGANKVPITINWSGFCRVKKVVKKGGDGAFDSIEKQTIEVGEEVANSIHLILNYERGEYENLSIQDMICLLDYLHENQKQNGVLKIPQPHLFLFRLQSIVVTNVEELNLLMILVSSFKHVILSVTSKQHLLKIVLSGIRRTAMIKSNWWNLILLLDFYFNSTANRETTDFFSKLKNEEETSWRNQVTHVISESMCQYYSVGDVLTVQSLLDAIFSHSGSSEKMFALFNNWIQKMNQRIGYSIRNMVALYLSNHCWYLSIHLNGAQTSQESQMNAKTGDTTVNSTYVCSKTEDGWRVMYTNSKDKSFIDQDDTFMFLRDHSWQTISITGSEMDSRKEWSIQNFFNSMFSVSIDVEQWATKILLKGKQNELIQQFYELRFDSMSIQESKNWFYMLTKK